MNQETLPHAEAIAHLQQMDPVLGHIIARCGPCTLQPRELEPLVMLCRSIVYQQLSGKAAGTIMMRFLGLYDPDALTPEALLRTADDTLRGIGLSRQKIAYMKDLATKVQDGALPLAKLPMHSDAEVMHQLMSVKGIGRWTAEMFLIFALGRLDVFPVDDLGIRKAMQRACGYQRLPAPTSASDHASSCAQVGPVSYCCHMVFVAQPGWGRHTLPGNASRRIQMIEGRIGEGHHIYQCDVVFGASDV